MRPLGSISLVLLLGFAIAPDLAADDVRGRGEGVAHRISVGADADRFRADPRAGAMSTVEPLAAGGAIGRVLGRGAEVGPAGTKPAAPTRRRAAQAGDDHKDLNEIIRSLAPIGYPSAPHSIDLDIRFELNSAVLRVDARRQLRTLARALASRELATSRFTIAGHTDASGTADYNLALSRRRAAAVADYLAREFGVSRERLETTGHGEARLKTPLDPTGAENRRVEVRLIQPPPGPASAATRDPAGAETQDGLGIDKDDEVKIRW